MEKDEIQISQKPAFMEPPKLVNRCRCLTFKPLGGCYNCGGDSFRYYGSSYGKKYYQCEKCRYVNH